MQISIDQQYAARLIDLHTLLQTVRDDKLDLGSWRRAVGGDDINPGIVAHEELRDLCGTTGCAVGWACSHPKFIEQGLYWDGCNPVFNDTNGMSYDGWEAAGLFFGLEGDTVYSLFANAGCGVVHSDRVDVSRYEDSGTEDLPDRRRVLARIRNFLMSCQVISVPEFESMKADEADLAA